MESKDYYQVLGVGKEAGPSEIKEAYRNLAFRYHPDRNHSSSDAMEKMKSVNEAYAVLSNPDKKKEYDALHQQYGSSAYNQFRKAYTDQDIYQNSDIHHIFEEMARSFGIRGFDEIFKEAQAQSTQTFEKKTPGVSVKGFFFSGWLSPGAFKLPSSLNMGRLFQTLLGRTGGPALTHKGKDINDLIYVRPSHALTGGPFAYYHRGQSKKLIVRLPPRMKTGQKIRLAGMGKPGKNGGRPGDLLITVHVKKSLKDSVKGLLGFFQRK